MGGVSSPGSGVASVSSGAVEPGLSAAIIASGVFLLVGMILGVWKYAQMMKRETHEANIYVDIAHRAALMYSPATLVLGGLVWLSTNAWWVDLVCVCVAVFYFATAVATYIVHGVRGTVGTQFSERNVITVAGMYGLIVGEIGAVAVLIWGAIRGASSLA